MFYVYIYTAHQDFPNKIRLESCEMGFVLKQVTRSLIILLESVTYYTI